MIFSAKNGDISAVLGVGTKFVEKTKSVGIKADKKANTIHLRLINEEGSYFHSSFSGKIQKSGEFSIGLDIFTSLIKAKNLELEFTVFDNKLHVKSLNSKLSGKDVPLLTEEVHLAPPSKKEMSFGKYQSTALLMMSESALPSFFQKVLPQYIVADKGNLTIATADMMYSAIATYPTEKLIIPQMVIPAQYARMMRDVIGDSCSISVKKDKFIIDTDLSHIELPMLQTDAIAPLETILALDKGKTIASFSVETQVLRSELENLLVVYEDRSPVCLKLKNASLSLNYKTNHGVFNSNIAVENAKNNTEWHLDVEMLRTLLARCSGKIQIEVKDSIMVMTYSPMKKLLIKCIIAKVNGS